MFLHNMFFAFSEQCQLEHIEVEAMTRYTSSFRSDRLMPTSSINSVAIEGGHLRFLIVGCHIANHKRLEAIHWVGGPMVLLLDVR